MPIYEYRCEHCGEFEKMQRITEPPLARCPTCHRKVRRLISSTSFQLKGSGWYVTDYGRAGNGAKKAEGSAAPASETKPESKGEGKPEAKPAGKSESKPEGKSASSNTGEKPTS